MIIYISSGPIFHRDSESEVRTLKFHQWHMIWLYLDFSHIWQKLDLHQSWWSIYHLDPFFTEILNLRSELQNSISGTWYVHVCILSLFWWNSTSTNHDDLYIIWACFLQRFQIQSQKFTNPSVESTFDTFLFNILLNVQDSRRDWAIFTDLTATIICQSCNTHVCINIS